MGLQEVAKQLTERLIGAGSDAFENKSEKSIAKELARGAVMLLVAGFIILLSGFLVRFLWNNSVPYMFTTARPVSSLGTIYAFMLFIYFVL